MDKRFSVVIAAYKGKNTFARPCAAMPVTPNGKIDRMALVNDLLMKPYENEQEEGQSVTFPSRMT
jgi:hypothetical protein